MPLLDEVEPSLGGRVDRAGLDRVQRALGERRERADRLHLVAEELDAQRLAAGRREDVDEAAADGELPAVVDPLDALVPGERELLRRALDALLGTGLQLERRRPAAGGGARSAIARAEAQTMPPRASTSSARARSPTRCGGGSSPDFQVTPRLGR